MFSIDKVELEDFKSFHGRHEFTLPTAPGLYNITGTNLVNPRLGANGIGKSTLLDAIYWCLYGRTTRGLKASDIVTWGKTSCSVTVTLRVDDFAHKIRRTQNPNSLERSNGAGMFLTIGQDDLQKHLRLSPDEFTYAVLVPQFGESFLDLSPAAKLALFSRIMDLDYWLEKSRVAEHLV